MLSSGLCAIGEHTVTPDRAVWEQVHASQHFREESLLEDISSCRRQNTDTLIPILPVELCPPGNSAGGPKHAPPGCTRMIYILEAGDRMCLTEIKLSSLMQINKIQDLNIHVWQQQPSIHPPCVGPLSVSTLQPTWYCSDCQSFSFSVYSASGLSDPL